VAPLLHYRTGKQRFGLSYLTFAAGKQAAPSMLMAFGF
jgi:hypothetical protein